MVTFPRPAIRGAFSGFAAVVLLLLGFVAVAAVGVPDGAPAPTVADAVERNASFAGLSGFLIGIAGIALAVFAVVLVGQSAAGRSSGVSVLGRAAGIAWGSFFIVGGATMIAAVELGGYQKDPEAAKTAWHLGFLLFANPVASFLGGTLALSVGYAARNALWPSWFRPFSLGAGGLTLVLSVVGAAGQIGLLGMVPLAIWAFVAALLAPWTAWRARDAPGGSSLTRGQAGTTR